MNAQNPPPVLSSSSTSSDEDIQRKRRRKRKWKDNFQRLLNDVIQKQEDKQKKFLDTLEKRERDRMAREDAWRVQEMARMNREHELLVHERSVAAAKEAALINFLHKVTEQHDLQLPITKNGDAQPPQAIKQVQSPRENPQLPPEKPQPPQQSNFQPPPPSPLQVLTPQAMTITPTKMPVAITKTNNGGDSSTPTGSSRWPKAEIEALINLRTNIDLKYQENGPKGPLWEEISRAMGRIGYNRSSKRCKEKWENINKYFKKVKESSKKRPQDSKTCPYFDQLDALYKERAKNEVAPSFNVPGYSNSVPIMAQPEQQRPQQQPQPDTVMHDQNHNESENDDNEEDYDDEEEDEGGRYEVVPSKKPVSGTN